MSESHRLYFEALASARSVLAVGVGMSRAATARSASRSRAAIQREISALDPLRIWAVTQLRTARRLMSRWRYPDVKRSSGVRFDQCCRLIGSPLQEKDMGQFSLYFPLGFEREGADRGRTATF